MIAICVALLVNELACGVGPAEVIAGVPLCPRHKRMMRRELLGVEAASVVYYVGDRADKTIKIGVSAHLPARLADLGRRRSIRLLATEPGTRALEIARHQQFSHLRHRGEWFYRHGSLMVHINDLRATHGIIHAGGKIPDQYLN
jgi:hypothetical protein